MSNISSKRILEIRIEKKISVNLSSYSLEGVCLSVIEIDRMTLCCGLTYTTNTVYVADHNAGILKVDLPTRRVNLLLSTDCHVLYKPHGITIQNQLNGT